MVPDLFFICESISIMTCSLAFSNPLLHPRFLSVLSHLQQGPNCKSFTLICTYERILFLSLPSHLHHGSTSPYLLNLFMKYDCVLFLVSLVFIELIWRLDWRWWSSNELLQHNQSLCQQLYQFILAYFLLLSHNSCRQGFGSGLILTGSGSSL